MYIHKKILVSGATGAQGGAVAKEALRQGFDVRVLVRDINSPGAKELIQYGAEAFEGNFDNQKSLENAMKDVDSVFSMTMPAFPGTDSERQQGLALINAALNSNVKQFVFTSVARAGKHESFPRWEENYWSKKYWTDKWDLEEAVRTAGFASWTIIKPAFMMENFLPPKAQNMFPHLQNGEIKTVIQPPDVRMDFISAENVASLACSAFCDPEAYNQKSINLASESLTMSEVSDIISKVTGKSVTAVSLTTEEAKNQGLHAGWIRTQEWNNEVGYQVDIKTLKQNHIELTFNEWAMNHRNQFIIN